MNQVGNQVGTNGTNWTARPLGRQLELTSFTQTLDDFTLGLPTVRVIEVTGDAGMGKTTLLREMVGMARAREAVVLAGSPQRRRPHGVWADAFDDQYELVRRTVERSSPFSHAELARAFPALAADPAPMTRPGPPEPPSRTLDPRPVRELLEELADPRLVLVLDDLHAADPASLELLGGLLRRPPNRAVLFVLGFRDRQAGIALREAVSDRSQHVAWHRMRLAPLTERDTGELLAGQGTASWRRKLHHDSGGNPAYLKALAAERMPFPGGSALPGPAGHEQTGENAIFLRELDDLPPVTRTVAEAAAVIGTEFDPGLVARVLDMSEPAVLTAIGELIRHDLLREVVSGQYFTFRHPVVARTIRAGTELSRRIEMHVNIDGVLQDRGAAPVERAPHVERWARYGDLEAADVLEAAATTVSASDPATAAPWLATALRVLPGGPASDARRARLLIRLAKARGALGYLRECRDTMHEALRILPTEPKAEHANAVAFTALVQRLLGAHAETEAMLRAEIEVLGKPESMACARLTYEFACCQLSSGDSASCREAAARALAVAKQHDQIPLQVACLGLLAMAEVTSGEIGAAADHTRGAVLLLDAMLDNDFAHSLDAVVWIGWSEVLLERWDEALRHFEKAVEVATRTQRWLVLPHLLVGVVFAQRNRGRLAEARAAAEHAVHLAEKSRSPEQTTSAYSTLSWIDATLGDLDRALESGLIATDQNRESASGWCETLAMRMLADVRLMSRDYEEAMALVSAAGGPDLADADVCSRVAWYELLTRAELMAGRPEAAAKWAQSAEAVATALRQPGRRALARLACAQVALATNSDSALQSAREAVWGLEKAGMTLDALRARTVLGTALWHDGSHDEGVRELKSVELASSRLGALTLSRQARTERRRLAAKSSNLRGRAEGRAWGLTGREKEVSDLVGEGMTNRLIARRLHIAEKTVEMHLSNIFAKIGVSSRAGVASYVTRNETDG
ncbi:helix-turn-helix transcriptional regulator [Amycolatopsis sp. H20-H5]|uniref:helix-turn-helix transcriptional regulator n=1 Tax=Amycolatopsis sp. H20-H5 TaxID=3046309 RepID=UPI002DBA6D11|nr:AAA family ATPase [Amycolatopsis sp. H20-H5]MEC3975015.1 AAA family ATPase [Amycolatopsis sp. H20-H5]